MMDSPDPTRPDERPAATNPQRRDRWSFTRVLLLVLVAGAALYAMIAGVFGITAIVVQALEGQAIMSFQPARFAEGGFGYFTSVGADGSTMAGSMESVRMGVNGLTGFALTLKAIGDALGVLAQVALALCAVGIGRALLGGRAFSRAVTRNAVVAAVALLGLGIASQLIGWWARVVILDEMDNVAFSRSLSLDPGLITAGLAVALVAVAFRYGERLQRDTEGLV